MNSFTEHIGGATMIKIKKSETADSRTCDTKTVSKDQLLNSSIQHIGDIEKGMEFFIGMMRNAISTHDHDKLSDIDGFYRDFKTNFEITTWWDNHKKVNRHHLFTPDGVPDDVNLIDVIELIVDCVMAGMARTGYVYPLEIEPELLQTAFQNTVDLLKKRIVVEEE